MFSSLNTAGVIAKMTPTNYRVGDLGMRSFGGSMMHAYRVETVGKSGRPNVSIEYVDGSGRLAGFSIDKTIMHMTNFGEPLHIVAPL